METDNQVSCSSSTVYYWKKPSPWRSPHWTQCRWRLLENGHLIWDTYKPKGVLRIPEIYHRMRIDSVDPKQFFNGIPHGVQMAPYILVLPMTCGSSTDPNGVRERWFAVSTFDELKYWIYKFAKVLQATDVITEMLRRAKKDLLIRNRDQVPKEDDILLEAWRQFVQGLHQVDQADQADEGSSLGEDIIRNANLVWAMSHVTSSIQMVML